MKAAFDWEDNADNWAGADYVRMMANGDSNDIAAGIYAPTALVRQYTIAFFVPENVDVFVHDTNCFDRLVDAKHYIDNALARAGYKTLPSHMRALL